MVSRMLNDIAFRAMEFALDGLALRQQTIADNIANVDTPGFKASGVSFEGELRQALADHPGLPLATTQENHIRTLSPNRSGRPQLVKRTNATLRNDGNNVDIDLEMSQLAETTITYNALSQLVAMKLSLLKDIARGGR